MDTQSLAAFIGTNREELLRRCRAKVLNRSSALSVPSEMMRGIPRFLDELVGELQVKGSPTKHREMSATATLHGADLFFNGCTVGQVVHDYGDVCQAVTDLAVELVTPISANDFRTLNRCLDDGIAFAVAEYSRQKQLGIADDSRDQSIKLYNLVEAAIAGYEVLQTGAVGISGTTGALVHRCLLELRGSLTKPPLS